MEPIMSENESTPVPAVSWVPLTARERRVLGVMAAELGWDDGRRAGERARLAAFYAARRL